MAQKTVLKKQLVRSTNAQINLFVDYMAANKDFANGVGEYSGVMGARKTNEEWETLRELLKEHGADKTVLQWKQSWRDLKRKARRAVGEKDKLQNPILSDVTFKILKTIGPVSQEYAIDLNGSRSPTGEDCDWNADSEEESCLTERMDSRNGQVEDEGSNESLELDGEDGKTSSVVEVTVPLPQVREDNTGSDKLLFDPLQTPVGDSPGVPLLAPKPPPPRAPPSASSPAAAPHPRTDLPERRAPGLRRRRAFPARRRDTRGSFEQPSGDYVSLERRRARMEEERDRRLHEREMERLKLELQRIEVQRDHNELLRRLVGIAQNAYELLRGNLQ